LSDNVTLHDEQSFTARTRLVLQWTEVAVRQEACARAARAALLSDHEAGRPPYMLKAELQPAMIAIAACAHALEALYAELAELVAPETVAAWEEARRGGSAAQVTGVLAHAVDVDVEQWRSRLKTLFEEWRNPAVHPKAKYRPIAKHPAFPSQVPHEYAIFSVETVETSIDLLLEILAASVERPTPPVESWANDRARISTA
jgi:hypothetical protein